MIHATPLLLCAALLGGCASGNPGYACPGYPGKPLCLPPSAVYSLSDGAGPPPASVARALPAETESGFAGGSGWAWTTRLRD
ncbi:hypothetical protein [Thiocapsa marina]|uniref:Type IV conjugative transfer system protein TraV n=1 Tax=Thiocapsa marina 5811 TaxID=768671 RepID=F9UHR7_9GAMM|nr:hypothetical protein [Thiocapsa marina]EGV16243.1 Type IV conjugative transfer system protein TraV [Thiocapsa marina 5811]